MKLDRAWHERDKTPERPTLEQRLDWHLRHQAACSCRPAPPAIQAEIDRRREAAG